MVATSHPLASRVALQMIERGGNAVDAGVAAALLLGQCEPMMTGLGGDLFALYVPPGGAPIALNASGRAPAKVDAAALRAEMGENLAPRSVHAITVPGAVKGFCRLADDHGTLGLDTLLAPAIDFAAAGIPVAPRTAFDWVGGAEKLWGAGITHFSNSGAGYAEGDLFRLTAHVPVLKAIAEQGAAGFYEGPVAEDMVAALQAAGGTHTLDDFAATGCDYVSPISTTYRGHELLELPPNGHGATALLLLDMLAGFDLPALDPFGADRIHLEAEAVKLAYDARDRFISDPSSIGDGLERLRGSAAGLASLIQPDRALPMPELRSKAGAVHKDTIYLCVVDPAGGVLSLIYSIFHDFGSGLASEKYGILFQNRGAGFTLAEGHCNQIAGGKRPLHTIIPALLMKDGRPVMPFGVMGGAYQPTGHARVVTNLLDYGFDLQTALDAPRTFPEAGGLKIETTLPASVREQLSGKGHRLFEADKPIGGAQAIWIDHDRGILVGASDPRKDGCALGY
ncbi:MAG: gamma-glutamyltransferase family protein [Pseudomonadota bacterium]